MTSRSDFWQSAHGGPLRQVTSRNWHELITSRREDYRVFGCPDCRGPHDVEEAAGDMSPFHDTYRVRADGVRIDTAELSERRQQRLATWTLCFQRSCRPTFVQQLSVAAGKL